MKHTQANHLATSGENLAANLAENLAALNADGAVHLGEQRFWYWRGWQIRYTHLASHLASRGAGHGASAQNHNAPLLLLHGAGSSLEQWRENLIAFAQERPVYALDLLGFGGSQKVASELNTDLWVAQVAAFWQAHLGGRPMILMGHSLGASVALQVATTHPEQVARLVMLTLPPDRQELGGTAAKVGAVVERWFASPLLLRPLFRLARRPSFIRSVLRRLHQNPERVNQDLIDGFVRPTQERGAARTFCYLVKSRTAASFSPMTQNLVPLLQIPALLLWGKCDRVVPISWGQFISTLNDQLTFVEVAGAGHFFYDESAADLHDLIDRWLRPEE